MPRRYLFFSLWIAHTHEGGNREDVTFVSGLRTSTTVISLNMLLIRGVCALMKVILLKVLLCHWFVHMHEGDNFEGVVSLWVKIIFAKVICTSKRSVQTSFLTSAGTAPH